MVIVFVVISIAKNPIGGDMAYEFIDSKWDNELMKRYKGDFTSLGRLLSGVLAGGTTQADLDRAISFIQRHHVKQSGARLVAKQAVASIRTQMKWLHNYEAPVVSWLKTKV